jgi:hypothetical protein
VALDTSVTAHDGPPSDSWTAGRVVSGAVVPRRTRRIAILGFAETVKDAPVNDPSWELWAMNGFWRAAKPDFGITVPEERYAAWFDTHTLEYSKAYGAKAGFGDAQVEWLAKPHPFPIYMLAAYPEVPSSVAYPIEDVIRSVGRDYFTSTVAYAIALAASMEDVAEIGLWGIDLAHDTEYADQRPCAEYHLGRAEGRGIKVALHERSALMRQLHRYGYEEEHPLLTELQAGLLKQRDGLAKAMSEDHAKQETLRLQIATNDGARQVIEQILARLGMYSRGGRF